jgi:hypothetical protein
MTVVCAAWAAPATVEASAPKIAVKKEIISVSKNGVRQKDSATADTANG